MSASEVIDFSTLTKKRKPKASTNPVKVEGPVEDADVQYEVMLNRIFEALKKSKGGVPNTQQKIIVKPPEVVKEGSKKTCWVNFLEICESLGRPEDHLSKFILMELGTEGSIARETQMILKGRFLDKHIENLLRKYITEYVMCQMCKSMDTILIKDSSIRMFTMTCKRCGCTRSVQSIKEGYHHVSKAERTKARND